MYTVDKHGALFAHCSWVISVMLKYIRTVLRVDDYNKAHLAVRDLN